MSAKKSLRHRNILYSKSLGLVMMLFVFVSRSNNMRTEEDMLEFDCMPSRLPEYQLSLAL